MRAILLAAGLGTRLYPLTKTIPKCLAPINGKPLLDIWCESLTKAGVTRLLVNLHYMSEYVQRHISESQFASQIETVYEPQLLGTAGTLVANLDFFCGDDGIVLHDDNYCEADIADIIAAHATRPAICDLTMLAFRTSSPDSCGILEVDKDNILKRMHEKSLSFNGNLANGAFYVLSSKLIGELNDEIDFSRDVIPKCYGRTLVVETSKKFVDIGTPASYAEAQTKSA